MSKTCACLFVCSCVCLAACFASVSQRPPSHAWLKENKFCFVLCFGSLGLWLVGRWSVASLACLGCLLALLRFLSFSPVSLLFTGYQPYCFQQGLGAVRVEACCSVLCLPGLLLCGGGSPAAAGCLFVCLFGCFVAFLFGFRIAPLVD